MDQQVFQKFIRLVQSIQLPKQKATAVLIIFSETRRLGAHFGFDPLLNCLLVTTAFMAPFKRKSVTLDASHNSAYVPEQAECLTPLCR